VLTVSAETCQVLSTGSPVDDGHRFASCDDTSLVVSGGVDCGRRRRNVYDKKPWRYAKDNRTAHLTARSDKSVAYVTNNKRLLDVLFCWSYSNYWQTRRPLCDSRATCYPYRPCLLPADEYCFWPRHNYVGLFVCLWVRSSSKWPDSLQLKIKLFFDGLDGDGDE